MRFSLFPWCDSPCSDVRVLRWGGRALVSTTSLGLQASSTSATITIAGLIGWVVLVQPDEEHAAALWGYRATRWRARRFPRRLADSWRLLWWPCERRLSVSSSTGSNTQPVVRAPARLASGRHSASHARARSTLGLVANGYCNVGHCCCWLINWITRWTWFFLFFVFETLMDLISSWSGWIGWNTFAECWTKLDSWIQFMWMWMFIYYYFTRSIDNWTDTIYNGDRLFDCLHII
jgi:hypothetical protein